MKQTIYIPVKAEEELPTIEDEYFVLINGVKQTAEFHKYEKTPGHMIIKENTWTQDDNDLYEYNVVPGYWLKPVEMPSEEEIHIIAQRIANKDGGGLWGDYYRAAKAGAQAITKLMKGEK